MKEEEHMLDLSAQTGLERKFCNDGGRLNLSEGALIEGYASVFGQTDQGGDVVEPGAYAASLAQLGTTGRTVKMLWQHDPAQPIGVWDEVREDAHGLFVKGRLLTNVARGAEAAALIEAGAIDGLSIGYRTRKASKQPAGTRLLSALDLWEVSLVTFPMLPDARVGAKSGDGPDGWLDDISAAFRDMRRALAGDGPNPLS